MTEETQVNKLGEGSGRCMFQEADCGVEGEEEHIPMHVFMEEIRVRRDLILGVKIDETEFKDPETEKKPGDSNISIEV